MKSLIVLEKKLSRLSCKCAKNQNHGFIRTYSGQVSDFLIHLSLPTFVLYIYRPYERN